MGIRAEDPGFNGSDSRSNPSLKIHESRFDLKFFFSLENVPLYIFGYLDSYYFKFKYRDIYDKLFLTLQACHYGLLTHPRIVADQRQHYNMARSMAVLSLSFIILVTPWTMKEVAVSCIGSKVRYSSLACSLSFFLQGISY